MLDSSLRAVAMTHIGVRGRRGGNSEPPLVLVVDDNERNRRLAADVLQKAGFRTLEAGTATEGIALAERHLPDVVLMDIRLPDIDGTTAARRLGEGAATASIPVVALTALRLQGNDDDWLHASGFAGYVEKKIDVSAFPEHVRGFCANG